LSTHARTGGAQLSCRVSGSSGTVHVYTNGPVIASDGTWHQVGCARVGNEVQVRLDGAVVATGSGTIGSVGSDKPYLIGSKGAGALADPDQYLGLLDDAVVEVDTVSGPEEPPPVLDDTATATVETEPVLSSGDAADDPAIWPHPTDPSKSVVIGNDKGGALEVYDLDGRRLQRIQEGFFGNVDLRTGVTIGGRTRDVIAVYRSGLRLYTIDPDTRRLANITDSSTGSLPVPTGGEGLCLFRSGTSGDTFAYAISRAGAVSQYRLTDVDADGLVDASRVRLWQMGSEAEGCVADDSGGRLYISEEDVAIWRYGAEPTDGTTAADRLPVDRVTSAGGGLAPDIEGLALVETAVGAGYLIASAQAGSDSTNYYSVYDRAGSNQFIRRFAVVNGPVTDRCGRTDGIAAYAGDLGPAFPRGVFICQDNTNTTPGTAGNQNFKLVPLERVVPLGSPLNQAPTAALQITCDALSCAFDASGSRDPEGQVLSFDWDLGDGTTATGPVVRHAYSWAGDYLLQLEVRDPQGAATGLSRNVRVSSVGQGTVAYRGSTGAAVNAASVSVQVPAVVEPGDTLLLAVAANRADVALNAPAGWATLGRQVDETMQSALWVRSAAPGDAGTVVRVTSSATTKMTAQMLAYSGLGSASPAVTVVSTNETGSSTAAHRTPVVTTSPRDWVVSWWADKTPSSTGWTPPVQVVPRQAQVTTGSGRVTALIADSGAPVTSTTSGGLVAVAGVAGTKATMWSIVLTPQ
jgi:3-phytase